MDVETGKRNFNTGSQVLANFVIISAVMILSKLMWNKNNGLTFLYNFMGSDKHFRDLTQIRQKTSGILTFAVKSCQAFL